MPFLNKVSGGSARKFGLSRRSVFYTCNTNTSIVTLNNTDRKCYYPANYNATASQGPFVGYSCPSGGANCGNECCGSSCAGGCCGWCSAYCYQCGGINTGYADGTGNYFCIHRPDWCYNASAVYSTVYSCPTNTSAVTLSGSSCVYPAAYNATENG